MAIKIFLDGANLADMETFAVDPRISGFTTNPTLMRKAGVINYEAFCRGALDIIGDKQPISFEVFADEFDDMQRQAIIISEWGENVYVKIPVTNTRGESSVDLIRNLSHRGIKVNVTAVFTRRQCQIVGDALVSDKRTLSIVSVFAGRVSDTGRTAMGHMLECRRVLSDTGSRAELLWASPRSVYDIKSAEHAGCHIITITKDLLGKTALLGKDLDEYSLETVEMFYQDGQLAGYKI